MRLKKNNVNIDVINFANPENVGRLQAMVDKANDNSEGQATSHFFDVPQGMNNITDVLITSPILQAEPMAMGGDAVGADGNVDPLIAMGIDPNIDPELAMALRLSLEEARAAENANAPIQVREEPVSNVQPGLQAAANDDNMYDDMNEEGDDDEKALQEALALSMVPDKTDDQPAQPKPEVAKQPEKQPEVDINEDFLKELAGELDIHLDQNELGDIMN